MSDSQHQYVIEAPTSDDGETNRPKIDDRVARADGSGTFEEEPTLEAVLDHIFDVGARERTLYAALLDSGPATVQELAAELDWQRSRVSRGLKRLHETGFVTRRRRIISSGGHIYEYTALLPETVTQLLYEGFEEWAGMARDALGEFREIDR